MKQYIKEYFTENNYAKFLAVAFLFLWLACFMAMFGAALSMVVGCGITSAAFGITAIISGCAQYG